MIFTKISIVSVSLLGAIVFPALNASAAPVSSLAFVASSSVLNTGLVQLVSHKHNGNASSSNGTGPTFYGRYQPEKPSTRKNYRNRSLWVEEEVNRLDANPGEIKPWSKAWLAYCTRRYRSFNSRTGYFTAYSGQKVFCRVKTRRAVKSGSQNTQINRRKCVRSSSGKCVANR